MEDVGSPARRIAGRRCRGIARLGRSRLHRSRRRWRRLRWWRGVDRQFNVAASAEFQRPPRPGCWLCLPCRGGREAHLDPIIGGDGDALAGASVSRFEARAINPRHRHVGLVLQNNGQFEFIAKVEEARRGGRTINGKRAVRLVRPCRSFPPLPPRQTMTR